MPRPARAARPRPTRRAQRLTFPAIEVAGGLLTPDIVAGIAETSGDADTRDAYGIPDGLDLRDEIARAFRMAEAQWNRFDAGHAADPDLSGRFVPAFLSSVFGFDDLADAPPVEKGDRVFPIGQAAGDGRIPVVIAPAGDPGRHRTNLDVLLPAFADGSRRRSATQLLQEYLNAEDACLWGLATDGLTLRLLRDNLSLTRPAWIEVDLAKIFRDRLYADFSALWLMIHRSRFGGPPALPSDCPLERWREQGRQDGVTARENLRAGVEAALALLGQGAIAHPANADLRAALSGGSLTPQGFYEELLGAVYRLIFLFAAEDQDLLHPSGTSGTARRAYADGYGVGRLRDRAMHRTAWNRHHDAWDGLRALFRALARGAPALGLPALGGLFDPGRTPHLDAAHIGNRPLMEAIFRLAWIRPAGQSLTRVNWRDMETEELGSVYEGLLELIPEIDLEARSFRFCETAGPGGSERKSTGSYYTPDALVRLVLDTTLDPLLDKAEAAPDPAAAILKLTVLDPACGSGHFLLGAARRMATRIAAAQSPGSPSREAFQHALREVVSHCIYGVDRNPLAAELCKVALWIEALEPGKPLSFLDARIRTGDSLIGVFDFASLVEGIPDAAYDALTGDDKDAAKQWRKWNREQREGRATTGMLDAFRPPTALVDKAREAAAMPEETIDQIAAKRRTFERLSTGEAWMLRKQACDLYVAAFFAPKQPLPKAPTKPEQHKLALARPAVSLTGHVWDAARGRQVYFPLTAACDTLCHDLRVLHWPLAFPAEMVRGGFDAVIGNPPWEVSQFSEQEFFANRDPEIASLHGNSRKKRIEELQKTNNDLWKFYLFAKHSFESANEYYRGSPRYPRTSRGKLNTYALFAEAFAALSRPDGRAGLIVPTGIATDSSTSVFFGHLIETKRLATLIDFENRRGVFPGVHRSYKFSVLTLGRTDSAQFTFFLFSPADLEETERHFSLSPVQIARINPNTKTVPIFRSRADAELTAKIYDRVPVFVEEQPEEEGGDVNPWSLSFQQGLFNMTSASEIFRTAEQLAATTHERDGTDWVQSDGSDRYVPLYEAKMIHHFDHRWATYGDGSASDEDGARDVTSAEKADPDFESTPRYWVPEWEVQLRAARVSSALKSAVRAQDETKALKALAEHVAAAWPAAWGRPANADDLGNTLGRSAPWREALGMSRDRWLATPSTQATLADLQRKTPLTDGALTELQTGADPSAPLDLARRLIRIRQPLWLMGWRDICRSTDERTVIAAVFPRFAVGHTMPLFFSTLKPVQAGALLALLSSLTLDFVARLKIGGTHLTYTYFHQLAALPPETFTAADIEFVTPRVLELTYTSLRMRPWAGNLGHQGSPFPWDPDRRAQLRAELDGFFARKYGLTRDELRYVLDPADTHGPDYPSETFRILRDKEIAQFGEYRTRRLVLEAWDQLERVEAVGAGTVAAAARPTPLPIDRATLPDGAWARSRLDQRSETGALLVALLKAMPGPLPIRQVRLAAVLALEPRLLTPHLTGQDSDTWHRLVGPESDPLPEGVPAFVARSDQAWGAAVRQLRGTEQLIEDTQAGTWSRGKGLGAIDTTGWPDGRAGMVLEVLKRVSRDSVETSLPDDVRGWIDEAAA